MEKKPIKRNGHIVKLSKDHHFALLFCWKIKNGIQFKVEPARMVKYVQYFWQQHLHPHFKQEETILFAPVEEPMVQRAMQEHLQITRQVQAFDAAENHTPDALAALCQAIDSHVRYEERELFPYLEQVLTEQQLIHIGEQLEAGHDPLLKDDFNDEFWTASKGAK